ncbi:PQQ-dependent sugar dehydrogenase [Halomonas daqingensis]|uniref:PQQ-dependent sugar dehydrogenase n=1 Tax=Billgrantia desiderata TaxID=52021 RepID=A0AAW4YPA3_9GAMM|nr:PQQ-dependent sugar dehydrogenase [Halomonas desiderata]MCE8050099.1 PQQ-dependent sugar dehydrogenase [Halomonas desiderata]SEF91801.1 Glucose/arabinose dehydrogenase, beta-propeller fold [Halomonas desiderata]
MHEANKPLSVVLLAGIAASGSALSTAALGVEVVEESISTEHMELRLERIAEGLENPWAVAMLPDGRFLVTERPGRLALIDEDGSITHLEGVPEVSAQGQGGLLDVTLHPRYGDGEHDWLYFTWSKPGDGGTATALSRARLSDDALSDVETLFEQDRFSGPGRHYGSRLAWLPDETLLMSIGDRGTPERAQAADDHAGSVLRLAADGSAPDDNPFADDDATLTEIYSLGNRNIQGMVVTEQGEIWATEHGPFGGDELNLIVAGENYGWPEVSQGRDYGTREPIGEDSLPGMQDPIHVFEAPFAPSGLAQVSSVTFGEWQGDLLAGGLRGERLYRLSIEGEQLADSEVVLDGQIGRIRGVHQGHDGAIYLVNDEAQGSLYRLRPVE